MQQPIIVDNSGGATFFDKLIKQHKNQMKFDLDDSDYQALENIGTGAYGIVCSAVHRKNGGKVAVKKIPNAFAAHTVLKRTLREVRILRFFRHENVIAVLDMFQPMSSSGQPGDVYIVFDLMETDLHHIIHSKQPLTERHVQYFMYQILNGLRYIHSANVIHRDLKPSNLMVNGNCALKIGDFGMARVINNSSDQASGHDQMFMTQYVATRWYRAPELLFSMLDYSFPVDLWSVGCILAEMLNRRQLFPGRDHISQIKLVVSYLGTPSDEVFKHIPSDLIKNIIMGIGRKTPLPWSAIAHRADATAQDILSKLLKIAPWERIAVCDALKHDYFNEFRKPEHETMLCQPLTLIHDDIEHLNADQLKEAMFEEVKKFTIVGDTGTSASSATENIAILQAVSARVVSDDVVMLSASVKSCAITNEIIAKDNLSTQPANEEADKQNLKAELYRKLIAKCQKDKTTVNVDISPKKTAKHHAAIRKRKKDKIDDNALLPDGTVKNKAALSEQDQTLLDRWTKLQQKSKTSELYTKAESCEITSDNEDEIESAEETEVLDNELKNIIVDSLPQLDSSKTDTSPSTAQLMEDWLIAANVNPEFLKEIESHSVRDIAMKSS